MSVSPADRALRYCILQEIQKDKPVFECYKSLCEKLQDDSLEYKEFDFWYHRFVNGNLELDYDRSLDPKVKSLESIPIEIVEEILDYLNFVDISLVRDVSRGFRALVDSKVNVFKELPFSIQFNQDLIEWCIGCKYCFMYEKVENGCKITSNGAEIFVDGGDYLKEFATQFSAVVKNRKLEISEFKVSSDASSESQEDFWRFTELLNAAFKSFNHQIHIAKAHFENVFIDTVYHILPSLKPRILENILVASIIESYNLKFEKIVEMEQWKRAIDLSVCSPSILNPFDIPISTILHANEFSYSCDYMSPEELVRVREILFNSPNFEKGFIEFSRPNDFQSMIAALGQATQRDAEVPKYRYYQRPGSDKTLLFHFDNYDDSIFIAKLSIEETDLV